ncbi:MAG TPA: tetratricopeptide repeat protein [Vicinamibacterales bacterium]|nr:tetratricopeptide repeat protein [Vicinamibacterales bacterium]
MKAQERHHLKQNEVAQTAARVVETFAANRDRIMMVSVVVLLVLAIGGGYLYWRKRTNDKAGAMLGIAMAVTQSQIVPAPTVPGATQAPNTYPTDRARQEAALKAFQEVAATYPSTDAGLAAQYHAAGALLSLGRLAEAEKAFADVAARTGSSVYVPMAKLGRAEALAGQTKYDDAIKALTDLSADRDGALPIDGVLMELARTCVKAGKKEEARAAFKRVVDEFPESAYSQDARQQLALLN